MATSSFDKKFVLDTKKAVDSFLKIANTPPKSVKIERGLVSREQESRGEKKLKRILSR
ncbi:hypothetical protein HYG86_00160 [Alkalicella caledoniensis]|uniref:Uncharacterized protein n=1 Tax=Alkalicella caledoniensis TaxID=2731377 RepID=A0A7G9W3N9_ALKCA|nr:hypothetical protein [Alkalicella caledoniensis]QNO13301.1 hypothetical protein HYG86_00160 [Alkalicella caledoniensis]